MYHVIDTIKMARSAPVISSVSCNESEVSYTSTAIVGLAEGSGVGNTEGAAVGSLVAPTSTNEETLIAVPETFSNALLNDARVATNADEFETAAVRSLTTLLYASVVFSLVEFS
jgi:hypothetical protein